MNPRVLVSLLIVAIACGDDAATDPTGMGTPDMGGDPMTGTTLRTGAPLQVAPVYQSQSRTEIFNRLERDLVPFDLDFAPSGQLWVLHRHSERDGYSDSLDCPRRAFSDAGFTDHDCGSLEGTTVTITSPEMPEMATVGNGRTRTVTDGNSWHFMRRPGGLAFGAESTTIQPDSPGADNTRGGSYIREPQTYTETFATCIEHATANFTDEAPFIGASLWTTDPSIYNGTDGIGGNGSHLDMVHATQYCMGIAYEGAGNVYWLFNGQDGMLDRYDFAEPHVPGHFYHGDATVDRYFWNDDSLARLPNVPSNMEMDEGTGLYIADSGNGRVVRFDTGADMPMFGTAPTFEGPTLMATTFEGVDREVVASATDLSALWGGGGAEPSGLSLLDDDALVVADHATGLISILERATGNEIRTFDTELGPGIGGLTVEDGVIYFVHMVDRMTYRVDVVAPETPTP